MKDNLQFKNFKIDNIQEDDKGLIIEGWGAKYGNKDAYGDIMQAGSCARTIKERGDRIAFCYQHDIYNPIGKILLIEDRTEGLFLSVKISDAEDDIKTKIREGILSEMSIGYRTINCIPSVVDGEDVNLLTEVMLYEVSLVTIAANPEAVITGMKSEERKEMLSTEFDRIIAIERNPEKQFNLMKLKSMIQLAFDNKAPESAEPPKTEPPTEKKFHKEEIINLLF
jgi:HK97 family phage prohead protease